NAGHRKLSCDNLESAAYGIGSVRRHNDTSPGEDHLYCSMYYSLGNILLGRYYLMYSWDHDAFCCATSISCVSWLALSPSKPATSSNWINRLSCSTRPHNLLSLPMSCALGGSRIMSAVRFRTSETPSTTVPIILPSKVRIMITVCALIV